MNAVVKKCDLNVRVAWQSKNTLKSRLTRSAFSLPKCPAGTRMCNACESGLKGKCLTSGVVYRLTCATCQKEGKNVTYIGETKRPIRLRFNEHVLCARNKTPDTPIGDHFIDAHQHYVLQKKEIPLTVEILQRTGDHPHRKICESLLIRVHKPQLNRNVSSWYIM